MAENDHVRALQEVQSKLNELSRRLDGFESRLQSVQAQLPQTAGPAKPPPLPPDYLRAENALAAAKKTPQLQEANTQGSLPSCGAGDSPAHAGHFQDLQAAAPAAGQAHGPGQSRTAPQLPPAIEASPAAPPAATAARALTPRTLSIEQVIGARWMLIAGVVALIAAGGYFFKLAYDKGWITPMHRLVMGGVFGLVLIAGGCWMLRKKLNAFAGAMMGVGIVWMYQSIYVASPSGLWQGLHAVSTPTSFALMCAVTILGMTLGACRRTP